MTAPVFTEVGGGKALGHVTRWWCFVPAKGTPYVVIRELWTVNVPEGCLPIRDIFEIEIKREPQLPGQDTLPGPGACDCCTSGRFDGSDDMIAPVPCATCGHDLWWHRGYEDRKPDD